jgi:hypothetical protein
MISDEVFFIAKHVMTKKISSPHEWRMKAFHRQLCDDLNFSSIATCLWMSLFD